jgi:hypothetical protein
VDMPSLKDPVDTVLGWALPNSPMVVPTLMVVE